MILSYELRAAVLCFGVFFLLHALLGGLALYLAARRRRLHDRIAPVQAANWLATLRLAPPVIALALTAMIVAPAYFRWERQAGSEPVSVLLVAAASLGVAICLTGFVRAGWILYRSQKSCEASSQQIVETPALFIGIAGFRRPRIIVSRGFLETVPPQGRDLAMRHEMAHFRAADNLKRFLFLLAPPLLPGLSGFQTLEDSWKRYAERAADDEAVSGDPRDAAILASLLVSMARSLNNKPGAWRQSSALVSALVDSGEDLRARVERLLANPGGRPAPATQAAYAPAAVIAVCAITAAAALTLAAGPSKVIFHELERLLLHG